MLVHLQMYFHLPVTWSSKLILGDFVVLVSTTKPPSMSFKLQVEVGEPDMTSLRIPRKTFFWIKETTGTHPLIHFGKDFQYFQKKYHFWIDRKNTF